MDNRIERQRRIIAEHIQSENEHNWQAVYDTFVQDERAHYDVVPLGTSFKGIEGVRNFYQLIATAVPDLHIAVVSEHHVPGCAFLEVIISGSHLGEYLGMKPLGNKIRVELASIYTFDEQSEKLIAERIYYDQASILQQMSGNQAAAVA